MGLNSISLLIDHMAWADSKLWQSVLKLASANSDSTLKNLLYHIHTVQRAFFNIWTEQLLEFPKETDFPELSAMAKWGYEYYQQLNEYLKTLNENELNKIIDVPWAKRLEKFVGKTPVSPSLEETMLQVTMHSAYHRGQANARLRELEGEPQLIDFIVWIWQGKPGAEWDIVA
jgi:uncharacterized damage-inducible protein DinB